MRVFATTFVLAVAAAFALYIWGARISTPAAAPGTYTLGTVVDMSKLTGQKRPYLGNGWILAPWGVWTDGPKSSLSIPIKDAVTADLNFAITAVPYLDESAKKQLIVVSAGGKKVGEWLFSGADKRPDRTIIIPKSAVSGGKLDLTFDLPDAAKPKGVTRAIALGLKTFKLSKVAP